MSTPKAFYSYLENEKKLNKLSDEQAGRLYKALFAYSRTGEKPDFSDDQALDYALADFAMDIDRDRERYQKTCERRAEAGKKGGRPKVNDSSDEKPNAISEKAKKAIAFSEKQKVFEKSKKSEAEAEAEAEADNISHDIFNESARPDFDERAGRVIELFKSICKDFVQPGKLTEHRKRLIYQAERDGIDFELLFRKAQESKFLSSTNGIGFDWILTPANAQKILDGNYNKDFKPPDRTKRRDSLYSTAGASFDVFALEKRSMFDD